MSLAEMTRRGLELLLDPYPPAGTSKKPWRLPRVEGRRLRVDLARLRDYAVLDEETRGLAGPED